MSTPDTEDWVKEFDALEGEHIKAYSLDDWRKTKDFIRSLLTSRDTYWKERVIDVIERLKIDERNTREYLTGSGEGWVAESYEDKMLVNAVYFHLQSVVRDLTPTPITKDNLK